ncbi:hypothetical protein SLA2020_418030 [Shorea laevis]
MALGFQASANQRSSPSILRSGSPRQRWFWSRQLHRRRRCFRQMQVKRLDKMDFCRLAQLCQRLSSSQPRFRRRLI